MKFGDRPVMSPMDEMFDLDGNGQMDIVEESMEVQFIADLMGEDSDQEEDEETDDFEEDEDLDFDDDEDEDDDF